MNAVPAKQQLEPVFAQVEAWRGRMLDLRPAAPGLVSPSHRGVDSERFLLSVDGARPEHLVKIIHPEHATFVALDQVLAAARSAADLGCGPRIVAADPALGTMIMDHLGEGWRTGCMDDLRDLDVMTRVLELKARIHAGPAMIATWSIFDRLRTFDDARRQAGVEGPDDLWWMLDAVADIEQAIDAAGIDVRPSHGDGLASNIMLGPDGAVMLVDFDEARNTDPFYEIGCLLNEAFAFDDEMAPALEQFEGSFRSQTLSRCRLYGIADDLTWAIWALTMDATSTRGGVEFLKYANWRLLRCRQALLHPDFERKLRTL